MPTVTAKQTFALSIDDLWDLLGDFGNTSKWSGSPPEACVCNETGIGALRERRFADGRVIVDRLEAETDYSYTYSVVSGPLPYKSYQATMAVQRIDDTHSEFSWTGVFEMKEMTDEEGITFTNNVYAMGIEMMKKTIGAI